MPIKERPYLEHIKRLIAEDYSSHTIINAIVAMFPDTDSRHTISNCITRARLTKPVPIPEPTVEELVEDDLKSRKIKAELNIVKRKYDALVREYEMSERRLDVALALKSPIIASEIVASLTDDHDEAVPIIQLSDWHFEERVDSISVNGLNEYNLEIGKRRWDTCIQNSVKLIEKERDYADIETMVLWLGGDFITGYIHEELEENNYLSPTEATLFATARIVDAIKYYKENADLKKIIIVCNYGNHGRTTVKSRVTTGYKNSYEWMMYKTLATMYKDDEQLEFVIPDSAFAYVTVLGYTCRFWHGDTIKYGGGIGGITVPLTKAIMRYNEQIEAEYSFLGHWHTYWEAVKGVIVNGSGIGFNPYAQRIGAKNEPPQQGFCLIDKKRGMTIRTCIFCE